MSDGTDMGVPYGEGVIQWWETGRADPDEAQDWFASELDALALRFKAKFPQTVARITSET